MRGVIGLDRSDVVDVCMMSSFVCVCFVMSIKDQIQSYKKKIDTFSLIIIQLHLIPARRTKLQEGTIMPVRSYRAALTAQRGVFSVFT